MALSFGRGILALVSVALAGASAEAQTPPTASTIDAAASPDASPGPHPYAPSSGYASSSSGVIYPQVALPVSSLGGDREALAAALSAARRGDGGGAQAAMAQISDPAARKLALWAAVDSEGEQLSFFQLDQARRDLSGWPRGARRQQAAEKTIETSGLDPARVIAWFQGAEPQSPQGAMALAAAYEQLGRRPDAQNLIRHWWRTKAFEADVQRTMLSRFADLLSQDDHVARADALLYGQQGPAAHDMLALLPADQRAAAEARMALRSEARNASALVDALPANLASQPGVAVERAHYLQKHGLDALALGLVSQFPSTPLTEEGSARVWSLRKLLINAAMRAHDYRGAYAAATNHGMTAGSDFAEAEFYAGWIALSKLHDPAAADLHFANIQAVGASPITQGRALYWRGRAAEARGDLAAAKAFYGQGARYYTVFYGQLAAEKAGLTTISIGRDPVPSAADRARFEGRETVRAARLLVELGHRDLYRTFVLSIAETLPDAEEYALLVDMARDYGDQDLAMRAVRTGAQHGYILPERGYPLRSAPSGYDAADPAIVFGITRQESGFDPHVRSGVGARGMMQLMPGTAQVLARRMGERYSVGMLDDPEYNMRLGSIYIGHMITDFGGSYVMATAAYNAGPGRPADWAGFCGDPRSSSVDPVDFIECIPFSETRNYVMRVLEGAQVYRARLHGGTAPMTLAEDLKRGGYTYSAPTYAATTASTPQPYTPPATAAAPAAPATQDDPIGRLLDQ